MPSYLCFLACLTLNIVLPLSSFPEFAPQPQFVAASPDGGGVLYWSKDGRTVDFVPSDQRQELKWGYFTRFDAQTGAFSAPKPPHAPLELESSFETENSSVEVVSTQTRRGVPLQDTPYEQFGFDVDSFSYGWRFQDSHFSSDWKRVSIVSDGAFHTWSTNTGRLLRTVRFTAPQNGGFASFSPDGRFVLASLPGLGPSKAALFEARNGHQVFTLDGSSQSGFWAGFLRGSELLVSRDRGNSTVGSVASVWSVRQGRKLWSVVGGSVDHLPGSDLAIVSRDERTGLHEQLELRDVLTGRLKQTLKHPAKTLWYVAPSPDGTQIWATYADGEIWRWSAIPRNTTDKNRSLERFGSDFAPHFDFGDKNWGAEA